MNLLRMTVLMAAMTALFVTVGYLAAGPNGMVLAFLFAAGSNLFAYWNSDRMVLSLYRAQQAAPGSRLVQIVEGLARNANLPMPAVYIAENPQPNAFATGRDPDHAAVCVTTGLLDSVSDEELAGVLSHELGHIKHRDTLTMTIVATMAGAVSMIANWAMWSGIFGGTREERDSGLGLAGALIVAMLAPVAAALVQMAISRTREFEADREGALISGRPLWLASALRNIERRAEIIDNPIADANPATAHMFIVNPLSGGGMAALFASHPPMEQRIARLEAMAGAPAADDGFKSPWA